jgi:DNA topoisomerase-1
MQLVIVESPGQGQDHREIPGQGLQGSRLSYGHVRDLPPKDGSVRPDEDFAMDWELYGDKQKRQVKAIADACQGGRPPDPRDRP